jgi:dTDP-4-dehydrorhamnose 3,5-epimerase
MTLRYAVPVGNIKLVLFDDRSESPTRGEIQEIFLGPDNYCLVTIPPEIWNGFKGIGTGMALVANCATLPHDPQEILRRDPSDPSIPYGWGIRQRCPRTF